MLGSDSMASIALDVPQGCICHPGMRRQETRLVEFIHVIPTADLDPALTGQEGWVFKPS